MRGPLLICLAGMLASTILAAAPASASAASDCERIAGSPYDPRFEGNPHWIEDADAAIAICSEALAANPGSTDLSTWLGRAYVEAFEPGKAVPHLKLGAEGGNRVAKVLYARLLLDGVHVRKQPEAALAMLKPLVDEGFASAQNLMGVAYDNGNGVPLDEERAAELYRLAADQGFAGAQVNLGVLYEEGRVVEQNYSEAFRLYSLAAAQNDPIGQYNLGWLYESGHGVPQDHAKAREFYEKAATSNDPFAVNQLGHYASEGLGG